MATAEHQIPTLPPGCELHGYRIEKVLGKGGMGTVYLARQLSMDRAVALKVLHPSRMHKAGVAEAFFREAAAASKLLHPSLVLVHDLHNDPEQDYYAYSMEYVAGTTAAELVRSKPLPWQRVIEIGRQIAGALACAHKGGLIHRDVKPENVIVPAEGPARLLDLGLAAGRHIHRERTEPSLAAGRRLLLVGTLDYTAPEQARHPARAAATSDVWSLGATLHFLLTGRPPFLGESLIDLALRIMAEPRPEIPKVPAAVNQVLDKLMTKRASERPTDGAAAEALLAAVPLTPTGPANDEPDEGKGDGRIGLHPAVRRRRLREQQER